MRLERKLSAILPPNMEADRVHGWILWSLTAPAFVCAILFLVRYYQAYDQLWWSSYSPWPGELRALMAPFAQCAVWTLLVYPVLAVVALATAAVLYSSYYQGSRSIYLMRRLPDGRSLLRRQVWTAPVCWALTILLSGAVLMGLCWLLWRFKTPAECLPTPENIARLEALDRTRLNFYYQ